MADTIYTAEATSTGGGRDGRVRSADGIIDLDVKQPPALGGPGGGTNPEQLFAAAYAACFHGAVRLAAKKKDVTIGETSVDAAVSVAPDETTLQVSAVLTVHLPGVEQAVADDVVAFAHELCPYSKATRGNVDVQLVAKV
ncbi:Ohr family peroxiredoxin [Pseudonocardia kunmingensis]|uniref:Ohr subfamily peroxiredoxin n=1 Tax=Pseudonocardia kunmingensis TaxID=630975 RepID=A0A543DB04_9PSEU|nr:Ohr family peroxiredoxin [Pseudonocardia kunmingensis]TQM06465.1 Ohr subfamily peroxiredoxin [Pseudonocardia kunmingensis]